MAQSLLQKLQWKDQESLLFFNPSDDLGAAIAALARIIRRIGRRRTISFALTFVRT